MDSNEDTLVPGQVVLILVGLIGSGKSTFAKALEACVPQFRRCNQDDLGDRRSVENLARQTLRAGNSACIDRTNFDAAQRSHWIRIARERPGTEIWVLVFNTPVEECARRLQYRRNHPTIATPELALSLLSRFHSDYRAPTPDEGYDRIYQLNVEEQAEIYENERVIKVVTALKESPKVDAWGVDWSAGGDWSAEPSNPFTLPPRGGRGRGGDPGRGFRGRARGRGRGDNNAWGRGGSRSGPPRGRGFRGASGEAPLMAQVGLGRSGI